MKPSSAPYIIHYASLMLITLLIFIFNNESLAQVRRDSLVEEAPPIDLQEPSPPPAGIPIDEEVFMFVEVMPRFPGCEGMGLKGQELTGCASQKMYEFVAQHLRYPKEARENGVQGDVVAQFVVDSEGSIRNIRIARSLGLGTDEEVIRVLQSMPKWIPGYHSGKPVAVRFMMPFKFKFSEPEVKD
jgi:protein TonB